MPAARTRDAQVVAALARRVASADILTRHNFAWFAARRGDVRTALECVRSVVAEGDAPHASWRALERLAAGRTDGLLLAAAGAPDVVAVRPARPLSAAVSAHQHGDIAVAEACYRAALADESLTAAAWNGLAVLHEMRRERVAAEEGWHRSIAAGNIAGIHNHALAVLRRGFPHRARAALAMAVAPADAPAPLLALAGLAALADQDPAAAVLLLARAASRDRDSARAHFALGLACERIGRHADALAAIRRALLLSPWYVPQAWLLEPEVGGPVVEQPAPAEDEAASSHGADVLLALGRSLLQTGHLAEALAVFDQVLSHEPARPAALFHRGVVLAKLRRYGEALEDWEQVGHTDGSELADVSRRHARSARQLASLFVGA